MMPSGLHDEYKDGKKEADFVYNGIVRKAILEAFGGDVAVVRETDSRKPGAITRSIIEHVAGADICIVDITGQNPNVFLELGIRYALRRSCTILLKQEETANPFDIHNYRCVVYSPRFEGVEKAIRDIADAIHSVLTLSKQQRLYTDSLVFEVYPEMAVTIPGVIREPEEETLSAQHMPWSEYWNQLERVVEKMRNYFQDGRFVPDVVLGISNGGLVYADLLGRELFSGIPILSLWADRQNKEGKFFENAINEAVVGAISRLSSSSREHASILLVDDIVASGNTVVQALNYLKKRIPFGEIVFLPLFSRNEKYFDLIKDDVIWLSELFNWTEEAIVGMHATDRIYLPYEKEIRST